MTASPEDSAAAVAAHTPGPIPASYLAALARAWVKRDGLPTPDGSRVVKEGEFYVKEDARLRMEISVFFGGWYVPVLDELGQTGARLLAPTLQSGKGRGRNRVHSQKEWIADFVAAATGSAS